MLSLVGNQIPLIFQFGLFFQLIMYIYLEFFFTSFFNKLSFRVNKSVYITWFRQWHDVAGNIFFLHEPNHALEDFCNHGVDKFH